MRKFDKPLNPAQIRTIRDDDIDYSDIAELDETFWNHAQLVKPDRRTRITRWVRRLLENLPCATVDGTKSQTNRVRRKSSRAHDHRK
ncbi:MAG: hypothetical protein OXG25_10260 [Gammaproteobacteria bacterium]|nr:hypothetical protein [Gammaproteobacteria bacterium]